MCFRCTLKQKFNVRISLSMHSLGENKRSTRHLRQLLNFTLHPGYRNPRIRFTIFVAAHGVRRIKKNRRKLGGESLKFYDQGNVNTADARTPNQTKWQCYQRREGCKGSVPLHTGKQRVCRLQDDRPTCHSCSKPSSYGNSGLEKGYIA